MKRKRESRVNYNQSAFNLQKKSKNVGRNAPNFKNWLPQIYNRPPSL